MSNWISYLMSIATGSKPPFIESIPALEIPEINQTIARYLNKKSLRSSTIVCKQWNRLFTPHLYNEVSIHNYSKEIPEETLQMYSRHIRKLTIDRVPSAAITAGINGLKVLYLYDRSDEGVVQIWTGIPQLILQNPNLSELKFVHKSDEQSSVEIVKAISNCHSLKYLSIDMNRLDQQTAKTIFNACAHLESLSIYSFQDDTTPFDSDSADSGTINFFDQWDIFPELSYLDISYTSKFNPFYYPEIIRRSPRLQFLRLTLNKDKMNMQELCNAISTNCQELSALRLVQGYSGQSDLLVPDIDICKLIESCKNIVYIDAKDTQFGPISMNSLRRCFNMLVHLDIKCCPNIPDCPMIYDVLTSCPRLRTLCAYSINAKDLLGIQSENHDLSQVESQEWACKNLEKFDIHICGLEGKPKEWQRLILLKLAKLEKLEYLDVGRCPHEPMVTHHDLDLRLGSGLRILGKLKRLKTFGFDHTEQKMGWQDIYWMINAWPNLEYFIGKFHHESSSNFVTFLLGSRGIKLSQRTSNNGFGHPGFGSGHYGMITLG
ncbi:hypothetical protein BGZ76_002876 [Entomortierella beljakovae]|nr:hypothetical protein BGZ76_002876 [Entomortierella beljakovae]